MKQKTLAILFCLLTLGLSAQNVRYVKPTAVGDASGSSWNNASSSIQSMVDALINTGGTVYVATGIYNGNFIMRDSVNVYGGFIGTETNPILSNIDTLNNKTILNANGVGRVLNQPADFKVPTEWAGFCITGGNTDVGGACLLRNKGTLRLCTVTNNTAEDGGGVLNSGTVTNCTFINNTAGEGGGIYNMYGTVTNCTFIGNMATWYGGGVFNMYGIVSNCTIAANIATQTGGGVFNYATITNCTIAGNIANERGGGINNNGGAISNCIVTNNTANNGGGIRNNDGTISNCILTGNTANNGGGISIISHGYGKERPFVANCIIADNMASLGGGIFMQPGDGFLDYSPLITNCTITGNTASSGGGVYNYYSLLNNCIVWGNNQKTDSIDIYNDMGTVSHTLYGKSNDIITNNYNIADTDPLFVDSSASNYHLRKGSLAIDMGNNNVVPAGVIYDFDNNARIYNGIVDLGAFEYIQSSIATLNNLTVVPGTLSPTFDSNFTEYAVTVNTDKITITAETTDTAASISGNGEKKLEEGENTFIITVTAEDGSELKYKVSVTRQTEAGLYNKSRTTSVIYPNPAINEFRITGIERMAQLTITNLSGKIMQSCMISSGESINIASLIKGIYFVKVNDQTLKLIKL